MENNPAPKSFAAGSVIRSLENPSFRYRLNVVTQARPFMSKPGVEATYTVLADGWTSALAGFFPYDDYVEEAPEAESFDQALARFVQVNNDAIKAYFAAHYPRLTPPELVVDPNGQKYIRIVQEDRGGGTGRSAWCFVERATGNVLKCDGWKRPAKQPRGSIYSKDYAGYGVTHNGPKYIR